MLIRGSFWYIKNRIKTTTNYCLWKTYKNKDIKAASDFHCNCIKNTLKQEGVYILCTNSHWTPLNPTDPYWAPRSPTGSYQAPMTSSDPQRSPMTTNDSPLTPNERYGAPLSATKHHGPLLSHNETSAELKWSASSQPQKQSPNHLQWH